MEEEEGIKTHDAGGGRGDEPDNSSRYAGCDYGAQGQGHGQRSHYWP